MSCFSDARFWATIIHEKGVHIALESYLNNAPRSYALHSKLFNNEMKLVVNSIHQLVFKVFLRISTTNESRMNSMSPQYFGSTIYSKFIFDIPKLIDICTVFGWSDEYKTLLRKMVLDVYTSNAKFAQDLEAALNGYVAIFDTFKDSLGVGDQGRPRLDGLNWCDLSKSIYVIADACVSLSLFVDILPTAAKVSHEMNLESVLANFYEQAFAPIQEELVERFASPEIEP